MEKRLIYIVMLWICWLINCSKVKAQYSFSSDRWMEYVEQMVVENENDEEVENLYNDLSYLADHPFDLNVITAEQLRRLPFLSDRQIEGIISYREKYGKLASIYELKLIETLDFPTIELILPFVYVGELTVEKLSPTVHNLLKYGRNELLVRYDQCFQQKAGYEAQPDSILEKYPNRRYLGEPFYHSLRYSFTFDDRLQAGFVGEKDAGEPFWNEHHKGYDYYSFHLLMRDMKALTTLALGDYKASFGQGLVISHDFSPGRNAMVTQAERRTHGFRRHFSTNEKDFLRGAAATLSFGNVDISLFYSYRKLDATLTDSTTVSAIKTDGLHRLPREREKQGVLPMHTFGGNIRYAVPRFSLGLTAVSYSFNKMRIEPAPKPYNIYYFRGSHHTNMSVDYKWKSRYLTLYGEAALSGDKSYALLNGLQLTPSSSFSALMLYRYYDRKYHAYFGNGFSQGTGVQNEEGLYLGLQFTPFARWKLSAYADFFRFPWLKYGVDAPSSGREYMAQMEYAQEKSISFYLRYKYRQKEKNTFPEGENSVSVVPYELHRIRLQIQYPILSFLLKTSLEGTIYDEAHTDKRRGLMLSQHVGWHPQRLPFRMDLFAAVFQTDDYSTRIPSYEKHILYAFGTSQFYGGGCRLSATFRWDIGGNLSLSGKLAHTHYRDREEIGTGMETIEGRNKTDLYALIRWKF